MAKITLEIRNWEKYNPKRDQNTYSWLRLDNRIGTDSKLYGLSAAQKYAFILILCEVSVHNGRAVSFDIEWLAHLSGTPLDEVADLIDFLEKNEIIVICGSARSPSDYVTTPTRRDETRRDEYNTCSLSENEKLTSSHEKTEKPKKQGTARKARCHSFDFEIPYKRFPKKLGKSQGMARCAAQIKTDKDYQDLLAAVGAFNVYHVTRGTQYEYLPYFSTFMNSWRDWLDPQNGSLQIPETKSKSLSEEQKQRLIAQDLELL